MDKQAKRRAILVFMQDRPGVLNKISGLIRRKMYNVDSLTVCSTLRQGISRMTITMRENNPEKITQVIRQIEKIPEVINAKELDREKSYWREVAIIKLETTQAVLDNLKREFYFELLDHPKTETFIIQIAGTSIFINAFIDDIGSENIIEIARTGVTSMVK